MKAEREPLLAAKARETASVNAFSPVQIGPLRLRNRFVKAATHGGHSFASMERMYCRMAANGVSLLTVAYVAVSERNKTFDNQCHISEANLGDWRSLVTKVRAAGGSMSAQLHQSGLFVMSSSGQPMGPSFFLLPSKPAWPRTMTRADIAAVTAEFATAAALCAEAGFACIEVHCGHGYLLSQFLTPLINRRSDSYGGSVAQRARFAVEVVEAVRAAAGPSIALVVKMNADDGLPLGGLRLPDAVRTAQLLSEAGADAIVPSFGYTSLNGFGMLRGDVPLKEMAEGMPSCWLRWLTRLLGPFLVPRIEYTSAFLRQHAAAFVAGLKQTGTAVVYVGGADSLSAVHELLSSGCVAVQVGRPLIREPWFVRKLEVADRAGKDAASSCIRCNQCTLAAMPGVDPKRFDGSCPFIGKGEGAPFGDIEDLSVSPMVSPQQAA